MCQLVKQCENPSIGGILVIQHDNRKRAVTYRKPSEFGKRNTGRLENQYSSIFDYRTPIGKRRIALVFPLLIHSYI